MERVPAKPSRRAGILLGLGLGGFLDEILLRDLPSHVPLYDWLFLGIGGLGLMLVGWALSRRAVIPERTGTGPVVPPVHR